MFRNIFYICVVVFLFCAFSPDPKSDQEGPKIAHVKKKIAELIDSSEVYIRSDTQKFNITIGKALQLAKNNQLRLDYLTLLKDHKLKFLVFYNKIEAWKAMLYDIENLITQLKKEGHSLPRNLNPELQTNWGIYYQEIGYHSRAIGLFKKSDQELLKLPKDSAVSYKRFFNALWLAAGYKKTGAYEASIQENLRAIDFYKQYEKLLKKPESIPYLSNICITLGDLYLTKNDTIKAYVYYRKSENLLREFFKLVPNPSVDPTTAVQNIKYSLVRYFNHIGQYDKSLKLLDEIKADSKITPPFKGKCLLGIGEVYFYQKKIGTAINYYQKAEDLFESIYSSKHPKTAVGNLRIAESYEYLKEWEQALFFYQKVLLNTIKNFNAIDPLENPNSISIQQINGKIELLMALKGKTRACYALYQMNNQLDFLNKAQEANNLAIALIDTIKSGLFLDKDRLFQVANHYTVYEQAIEIALEQSKFNLQQEDQLQDRIFTLIEQSKGLMLQAVYNKLEGIGESSNEKLSKLIEKERQLKYVLAKREEELTRRNASLATDQIYLQLQYKFSSWVQETKRANAQYYQQKYKSQSVSLKTLQRSSLSPNQAIIEYFWGEKQIFTLVITSSNVKVYQQDVTSLVDSLQALRTLVTDAAKISSIPTIVRIQKLSHYLYQGLLGPMLKDLNGKYSKLCIIRDGPLEYLPFEMLDISPKIRPGIFLKNDFLVSHYTISYAHLSTLFHKQQQALAPKYNKFFASFAPTYQNIKTKNNPDSQPLAFLERAGNLELPGAMEEAQKITHLVGGKLYQGNKASEKQFKTWAPQYSILHLPMHALANDQLPEASELFFTTPNPDPSEDGHFKAWELYGMRLNAQMVVLSACETGDGKLERGEGVISLAYAFFNAGVPSVISTQWSVNDKDTRIIMENFYRNLKKGMTKDRALQEAKKIFLEDKRLHPFYWAPIVASGNMGKIDFPFFSMHNGIFSTILISTIILLIGLCYRKMFGRGKTKLFHFF